MNDLYIGTSGYYFKDWPGPVYPERTSSKNMFSEYMKLGLNSVELNVTFYRMPDRKLLTGFADRAPDNFKYIIKAYKGITHDREQGTAEKFVDIYRESDIRGNFSGILLQYPESFHFNAHNMNEVIRHSKPMADIPVFVEFRGADWNSEETFSFLRENELNYVVVDLPPLTNLHRREPVVTGDYAYMRLHGRNMKWYNPETRYLYDYSQEELEVFESELKSMKPRKSTFVFFNNCHGGYAALNAVKLMKNAMSSS